MIANAKRAGGRTAGALALLLSLCFLAMPGLAAPWTSTSSPGGYYGHSLAYASGYLYQAGGSSFWDGIGDGDHVFYAPVLTNGTVGTWQSSTPLPERTLYHAGVAANGFLYVLGGWHYKDPGLLVVTNTVYYAKISADAKVGSWQVANPLPHPVMWHSASVWNNRIYVVGGFDDGTTYNDVYSAEIQTNGSLSAWVAQTPLPVTIATQAEAANGMIYVLGGAAGPMQFGANTVYCSKINPDGTLAGWNQTTPLPQLREYFGVVAVGGRLYSMGGTDGISPTSAFYSATVRGDGTLDAWTVGTPLPQPIYQHAVTCSDSYIYVSGGLDGIDRYINAVYSMALPAAPVAPVLTGTNLGNGSFQLRLASGQTNCGFGLNASTNLTDWERIGWGFTGTNGVLLFTDTNAVNNPTRYYRASWPLP